MASAGKMAIVGGKWELASGCEGAQVTFYPFISPPHPHSQQAHPDSVPLAWWQLQDHCCCSLGVSLWISCTAQLLGAANEGRDATLIKKWEGFHGQRLFFGHFDAFLACELLLVSVKDWKHGWTSKWFAKVNVILKIT